MIPNFRFVCNCLLFALMVCGCAGSFNPVAPGTSDPSIQSSSDNQKTAPEDQLEPETTPGTSTYDYSSRLLLGYYEVTYHEAGHLFEVVLIRHATDHYNVRWWLQTLPACDWPEPCISIIWDEPWPNPDIAEWPPGPWEVFYVQLRNPFQDIDYMGHDVRGIFTNYGSNTNFTDVRVSEYNVGTPSAPDPYDPENVDGAREHILVLPDGYTRLYNPAEYPQDWDWDPDLPPDPDDNRPPWTTYWGLNPQNPETATVNPYMRFSSDSDDPEQVFSPNDTITRRYLIAPTIMEGFTFGFAIDASWHEDGVPDGYSQEPWKLELPWQPMPILECDGVTTVGVNAYDHALTPNTAWLECPDIFDGMIEGSEYPMLDGFQYQWTISNELGASPGIYKGLISIVDNENDNDPHEIAYQFVDIEVIPGGVVPGIVTGLAATRNDWTNWKDIDENVVKLMWYPVDGADQYEIWYYPFDPYAGTNVFTLLDTVDHVGSSTQNYEHNTARYTGSGPSGLASLAPLNSAIHYQVRAIKNCPGDTLYGGFSPVRRGWPSPFIVDIALNVFYAPDDEDYNWWLRERALEDLEDCNIFWSQYGIYFRNVTTDDPFVVGHMYDTFSDDYWSLTLDEAETLNDDIFFHYNDVLNVYYVNKATDPRDPSGGPIFSTAYCHTYCEEGGVQINDLYIVLARDAGGEYSSSSCSDDGMWPQVLAHECGHAVPRLADTYLFDTYNNNLDLRQGTDCQGTATDLIDTLSWAHVNAHYNLNIMDWGEPYYSIDNYTAHPFQFFWHDVWLRGGDWIVDIDDDQVDYYIDCVIDPHIDNYHL